MIWMVPERRDILPEIHTKHPILLFDGVCNLCNSMVTFVIKHDKEANFKFASLQSEGGQTILKEHSLPLDQFDSFYYVDSKKLYTKSTAALKVAKELDGAWKLLYPLIIIPKPLRDIVYSFIARNRYRWFGKKDQCMLPNPEMKKRFL
ncbi:thiol-disulfide oxidoreductase DCC family protein [Sutcliffiella horikoshii]|uniref:Thiol-disulfide oxidoreductase DCC family protein n=1 Tax=Sutcliffiella horikoshii TaxID=79883 RepID=A0A5D4T5Y0_9BACI|nr:thiol-disulfide oxidoreductase DCC family protein [Sutcliffiella horikoshii]TYS70705.1 thiol-disulfide oxidoreductase DCC family protein [Sutcliffiella horikoshii]